MSAETTAKKQRGRPFPPGVSGNPSGRPKGSRNELGEDFIGDLHEHWQEHGPEALDACLEQSPAAYCKMVASLLPKDVNLSGAQGEQWLEALSNFNDIARAHRATLVKSEDGP